MSEPTSFLGGRVVLHGGDCRDVLKTLADNSIDSVVTDPPYALVSIVKRFGGDNASACKPGKTGAYARASAGFMGKKWDTGESSFAVEFWDEVLRVLKPGGHVAAFSGTRTYHRLACAVEDAGFEIRDQLAWTYGSGFPKSHDVSKGIDKAAGVEREILSRTSAKCGVFAHSGSGAVQNIQDYEHVVTVAATDSAREWQGWGTALKPSWEPIVLARKPISERTVAANVLRWRTGAINVDACRVEGELSEGRTRHGGGVPGAASSFELPDSRGAMPAGRWPANLIHDNSAEVLAGFPDSVSTGGDGYKESMFCGGKPTGVHGLGDSGSAARFFYSAKADSDDRMASKHPTVKPVDLMQWLVRLITPPGGTTLDPFSGTGTTGEAAWRGGFSAVLIEREAEYQADIARRMEYALAGPDARRHVILKAKGKVDHAGPLFAESAP